MDPIANLVNSLKLAAAAGRPSVIVPHSNLKQAIAVILENAGYLKKVTSLGKKNKKYLECFLAYDENRPRLTAVRRISKSSRRVYAGVKNLPPARRGKGLTIVSTPRGLLTDREARAAKVGGELLVEVW